MDRFRSMRSPASASSAAYHVQLLSTMNEGSHSGLKIAKLIPSCAVLYRLPHSIQSDAFSFKQLYR